MATPKQSNIDIAPLAILQSYNEATNSEWTINGVWSNSEKGFETFLYDHMFPILGSQHFYDNRVGNRFYFLTKFVDQTSILQKGAINTITDVFPEVMDYDIRRQSILEDNFLNMTGLVYGAGTRKIFKYTLDKVRMRANGLTPGSLIDMTTAPIKAVQKGIDISEELSVKGLLVDYANTQAREKRTVADMAGMVDALFHAIQDLQEWSNEYNECSDVTNGSALPNVLTNRVDIGDIFILTSNAVKVELSKEYYANTFHIAGIDFRDRLLTFKDLGKVYKLNADVTISSQGTVDLLKHYGQFQPIIGTVIPAGTIFCFKVDQLTEFVGKVDEVKPVNNDLFAFVMDINTVISEMCTNEMVKISDVKDAPLDLIDMYIKYTTRKIINPFTQKIVINGPSA